MKPKGFVGSSTESLEIGGNSARRRNINKHFWCSSGLLCKTYWKHDSRQVSAHPIKVGSFLGTNPVTIAQVNQSLRLQVTDVTLFVGEEPQNPTIRLIEGFREAFVQHLPPPRDPRGRFGADGNTQIRIQLSALPDGLELTWPDRVQSVQGVGSLCLAGSSRFAAVYEFSTTDQGESDSSLKVFDLVPQISLDSGATPGDLRVQAQLWPDTTSLRVPRFAHPPLNDPPDVLLRIRRHPGKK